jgi:glutamyl-tRNA synthetase
MLGWNDGTEQEIFSLEDLIQRFSIEKVHKGGAKFDFEKAKWFNHEWIKKTPVSEYHYGVKKIFEEKGLQINDETYFGKVLSLLKDRCTLLTDFWEQGHFFFQSPKEYNTVPIVAKWNEDKKKFFETFSASMTSVSSWNAGTLETLFKQLAEQASIKPGELQLPLRIMLVGDKYGPGVFNIAEVLGKEETINRIEAALSAFKF